jgi:hypothetical protein
LKFKLISHKKMYLKNLRNFKSIFQKIQKKYKKNMTLIMDFVLQKNMKIFLKDLN